jgi:hypothetical protein
MATFAEFYQAKINDDGNRSELVPACGDRSVIRLDGRNNQYNLELLAEQECKNRNYVAWRLTRGESLLRAKPITKIVSLYY